MPPHPLTNFEIQKYYQNEPKFTGVYSRNNLPRNNLIKDRAYLINLDEYKSVETHWIALFQPENIDPQDVPRTSHSNLHRMSPKDSIRPSRECPDRTSWGRPEMTSRGLSNLMFKGRPQEVDSGRPQDFLRSSPGRSSKYSHLDVPKFLLTFLSELIAFQHSRCTENPVKLLRWSIFCEIS